MEVVESRRFVTLPEGASVLPDRMSGFEFEELVGDILIRLRYGKVEAILSRQDKDKDILQRDNLLGLFGFRLVSLSGF